MNCLIHLSARTWARLALVIAFLIVLLPASSTALGASSLSQPENLVADSIDASQNCDIWWGQVLHDTYDSNYRSILGPATPGNTVRLRLRVAQSDLTGVRVRVWDDRTNTSTYYNMSWDGAFDTDPTTYDWWFANIPVGSQPTILYYFFELNDAPGWCSADQDFYTDDDPKFMGGGLGAMRDGYDDSKSFQITVYDPNFSVPSWLQRGVVYQIFPDRFRNGNTGNDPDTARFFYNELPTVWRSNQTDWNTTICDPRNLVAPTCLNIYSQNFYGGDLAGITEKINQGYFDSLGVTVLYLNPVFLSPSNHKYDTGDYLIIDPDFGTLAEFQALVAAANAHGMKIILDGVFNHTSADSQYFDLYRRYDSAGNLTSPSGPGTDDQSGACESPLSGYRSWFYIPDAVGSPALTGYCDSIDGDDPGGAWDTSYSAWYQYDSLPKLQANSTAVRNLIWNDTGAACDGTIANCPVSKYWVWQGVRGWRFDVGGDVDPGLTADPANDYWEGFRTSVRNVNGSGSDVVMLGEEWGDASPWLLGNEWDSTMNYRYRSAVLGWLFTGCSGSGCTGGTTFFDNDNNSGSSSGDIYYLSPSLFNLRLMSIWEDYPPMAWKGAMNLADSHDTNRLRWVLYKTNNNNDGAAVQRMKELWIFAFTYAGAPTLYYGDEMGLTGAGVWDGSTWQDDPYNRAPYPWDDETGSAYSADTTLLAHARKMSSIRQSYRALQDGDVVHGIVIDDTNKLYGFARVNGTQTALIVLNRDSASHAVNLSGLNAAPYNLPDGTILVDALNGSTYTVGSGQVSVTVNSSWAVVLLEQAKIDTPLPPADVSLTVSGDDVISSWRLVRQDTTGGVEAPTHYEVWISDSPTTRNPDADTKLADVYPPAFGSDDGMLTYTDVDALSGATGNQYYFIRAVNGSGASSAHSARWGVTPTAVVIERFQGVSGEWSVWAAAGLLLLALALALGMMLWLRRQDVCLR